MSATSNKPHAGFTVVELLVAIVVISLLATLIMTTLFNYYGANVTSLGKTTQDTETTAVLRTIEKELSNASLFSAQLGVSATPLGPNSSANPWSYRSNMTVDPDKHRVVIATSYATDKPVSDNSRLVVFGNNGDGCDEAKKVPMRVSSIYFTAKDTTQPGDIYNLYRRTIVNPDNYAACPGNPAVQKQTCAAGVTNPICKGTDATLLRNVSIFAVDYFSSANATAPIVNQYDVTSESLINSAKSINMTVTTQRKLDNKDTPSTASIRISLPN